MRAATFRLLMPAVLVAAALPAAAVDYQFAFTAQGISLPTPCDGGLPCVDVASAGIADDVPGLTEGLPGSWAVISSLRVDTASGLFTGTWTWSDLGDGGNDLAGSFSGQIAPIGPGLGLAQVSYTVTGGTGLFAGASGSGRSVVYGQQDTLAFAEAGVLSVTAVPEPASWALLACGLAGIGMARRRRLQPAHGGGAVAGAPGARGRGAQGGFGT